MSVTQATLLGNTFGSQASGVIPVGGIIMWSGTIATIPTGWSLCNGTNGTPNLQDRFIVGAGNAYGVAATGGSKDATLVSHSHTFSGRTGDDSPDHTHNYNGVEITEQTSGGNSTRPRREQEKTTTGASTRHQHDFSGGTSTEGSAATDKNLPPYYALAFIMRVS